MKTKDHLWAILLAAGEGTRIRSLTRTSDGQRAPKQFCSLDGRESLLRWTMKRARALVPDSRIVTIVAAQHREWWTRELLDLPRENVVVQPKNRGTAAGILLPLLHIVRRDPAARILVLPSDHYVANEKALYSAILKAVQAVELDDRRVVLVGMTPRGCDTQYGWIVPTSGNWPVRGVETFVEKPEASLATDLLGRGGLLNSLILVADAGTLLQLYARETPSLLDSLSGSRDAEITDPGILDAVYRSLPTHDFSRDVLEHSCDRLAVVAAPPCGWTDIGTPERLARLRESRATVSSAPGAA